MHGSPPRPRKRWIATQLLLAAAGLVALADVGGGRQAIDRGSAAAAVAADRQPDGLRDLADDPPRIEPASWIGGPITSLAPAGDLVWLAQGQRVWAVDLADPERPRDLGPGLRFAGEVDALAVDGAVGLAAVGSDLWVLNLAAPAAPRLGGRLALAPVPGGDGVVRVERILLWGELAFLRQAGSADDVAVNLRRPATPRLLPGSPFDLPRGTVIDGLLALGPLLVVKSVEPDPAGEADGGRRQLRLFDQRLSAPARALGRLDTAADAWGRRLDSSTERLVSVDETVGGDGDLLLRVWDLSDPRNPLVLERQQIPAPSRELCHDRSAAPVLTDDGRLYLACTVQVGIASWSGSLLRWVPPVSTPSGSWEPAVFGLAPVDAPVVAGGPRVLFRSTEGLHSYHSPSSTESRHPIVQGAEGLAAGRFSGLPSLLVNAGGLRRLNLSRPLDPVLQNAETFGFGLSREVVAGNDMTAIDFLGAGFGGAHLHDCAIQVADLRDPGSFGFAGQIGLGDTCSRGPIAMAQDGDLLGVIASPGRIDLYHLDAATGPTKAASIMAPQGSFAAIALHDGLLGALILNEASSHPDATTSLSLILYRLNTEGIPLNATTIGSRMLATVASAYPQAHGLLMTSDWPAISMALGCGGRREQGVMLLRLGPAPDEGSLYRQVWLRYTGKALLLHDGYLFVQATGGVSALDIRQVPERPWAWREAARLAVPSPQAMTALDHTVYVSTGSTGVAIFQPDLPWASDPAAPTPTEPPTPPPFTPTQPSIPCLSPTPTATASASASPSLTPSATRTARVSATPTGAPGRRLWLPAVRN